MTLKKKDSNAKLPQNKILVLWILQELDFCGWVGHMQSFSLTEMIGTEL